MINFEALFKISYGLYIVSSGTKEKGNGYIANTVFQITAEPPQFAISCNKNNLTTQFIQESGAFAVSILHKDTEPTIFGRFGFKSGKDINKLEGMSLTYGETGVPIVLNDCVAFMEFKLVQSVEVGTHIIFIGELLQADVVDNDKEPMTYAHYRQVRKGVAPKNAPTYIDKSKLAAKPPAPEHKKYKCTACGYIYDEAKEGKKFADLPADWVCAICGSEKDDFVEV